MKTTLYWLTQDLRLDDNAALLAAARSEHLVVAFCIEPRWFSQYRYHTASLGAHRWQFLKQGLEDLQASLQKLGQGIVYVVGEPQRCLADLVDQHAVDRVVCSYNVGVDEQRSVEAVAALRPRLLIEQVDTYALFDRHSSPMPSDRVVSYSKFRTLAEQQAINPPLAAPLSLPTPPNSLNTAELRGQRVPDLSGYAQTKCEYAGGESAGLAHLTRYFDSESALSYKLTRNALEGYSNSSKFSPWLNFGCLSARRVLAQLRDFETTQGANDSTYWLFIELLWREYFQWLAAQIGTKLFAAKGISQCGGFQCFYPERFEKWCQGTTPYPLVNACMRELKETGFLSNRGRQIAASCLVHELELDWRYGAAWFEHQLCDFDVASNWGNWQYIAGVGVDPRGGRHFNLQKQTELYDPKGHYIERWAPGPVLATLDTRDAADWPIG